MNPNPVRYESFARVWFLTWTTYATWLPGDRRGFVSPQFDRPTTKPRSNRPHTPYVAGRSELERRARANVVGEPVWLTREQAALVRTQFEETAQYRGWTIVAGAVMANHVHLLVGVLGDPEPADLLRDFKSYASRVLNRNFTRPASGTWWTEQGSRRKIRDAEHFMNAKRYVLRQDGALEVWQNEFIQGTDVPRSLDE